MNLNETVKYLAQSNSHKCYSKRLEEIDKTIPYFEIYKNQYGKYGINTFAFENHDNADRMNLWQKYLQQMILPNIDSNANIKGFYNIQLHDSYTYLNDGKNYNNILCFSKFKNDSDIVLIPDPYFICNWGNMLMGINSNINNDQEDWTRKKNKILFAGTTTGNRNYIKNERINLCLWGLNNTDYCHFRITKIAQMNPTDVQSKVFDFNKIYSDPINIYEQMKYKYQLNIDGNTSKFNVEQFIMNSVVMKYESKEMLWYYPLLQNEVHFIQVNKDTIKNKFDFYNSNPNLAKIMIYNSKKLANELFRPIIHQMYTVELFENISFNSG